MVKVSVIIPCYNTEKWLPDCLDSVLGQTLPEIEVICIDDASPDGCGRIMDEYAARDPRVKTIHLPENHKQGYGRNRGLEIAEGAYIYLLDSDDMITPDALERLYELAEAERLEGVFFNADIIYENEELRQRYPAEGRIRIGEYPDEPVTGLELFQAFRDQEEWNVYFQGQFWNRAFLEAHDIRFPEGIEHEDQLFSFEAIVSAERVHYKNWPFFIRRYRPDSVVTKETAWVNIHGYFVNLSLMAEFVQKNRIDAPVVRDHIKELITYFKSIYPRCRDIPHAEDRFAAQGLESSFLLFRLFYEVEMTGSEDEERFWERLAGYDDLTIYGAGRIADSVFRRLRLAGIPVERFAVTHPEQDQDRFHGRPVIGPDEIPHMENGAVLVAMAAVHHAEVAAELEKRGFTYLLYARGILRGPFGPDSP